MRNQTDKIKSYIEEAPLPISSNLSPKDPTCMFAIEMELSPLVIDELRSIAIKDECSNNLIKLTRFNKLIKHGRCELN